MHLASPENISCRTGCSCLIYFFRKWCGKTDLLCISGLVNWSATSRSEFSEALRWILKTKMRYAKAERSLAGLRIWYPSRPFRLNGNRSNPIKSWQLKVQGHWIWKWKAEPAESWTVPAFGPRTRNARHYANARICIAYMYLYVLFVSVYIRIFMYT